MDAIVGAQIGVDEGKMKERRTDCGGVMGVIAQPPPLMRSKVLAREFKSARELVCAQAYLRTEGSVCCFIAHLVPIRFVVRLQCSIRLVCVFSLCMLVSAWICWHRQCLCYNMMLCISKTFCALLNAY